MFHSRFQTTVRTTAPPQTEEGQFEKVKQEYSVIIRIIDIKEIDYNI